MSKKSSLIILFLVLSVMVTQIMEAAIIHVTTTNDNVPGSLRAAITEANTNGEDNTIYLPAGTYKLSGAASEDANAGGDLDINTNRKLTIIGQGQNISYIDGNGIDRVLHILKGTIAITDLTIRSGKAPNGRKWRINKNGGGIYNIGNLTMTRCVIKKNTAGKGGSNDGDFITTESGGYGGGIFNGGELTLNNCIVTGNIAGVGGASYEDDAPGMGGGGGGIWNSGILTLNNCAITLNYAGKGGDGLYPTDWRSGGSGGGIYNISTSNIIDCTISNNKTGDSGTCGDSKCGYSGDGGGIFNIGNLIMQGCTVNANVTGSDFTETSGGGIFSGGDYNPNLTLMACAISGNSAGTGGGVYNDGYAKLIGTTVVYNGSGGIRNNWGIRLINSIIAYNTLDNGDPGPDCIGTFKWVCYSLIGDTTNCILTGTQQFNILGQDPLLGPLADNGGPTKTHALLPGSPAIDAGNSSGLYTDQRGYKRKINIIGIPNVSDGADIGAYEYIVPFSTADPH